MIKKLLLTSALVAGIATSAYAAVGNSMSTDGLTVSLGGSFDGQVGFNGDQKSAFRYAVPYERGVFGDFAGTPFAATNVHGKLNEFSFVNDTKFWIKADGQNEAYGFKYGGMLKMFADTSESKHQTGGYVYDFDFAADPTVNRANTGRPAWKRVDDKGNAMQTMIYVEGIFGRVEMGSYTGASHAMQVDARTFARATGADDARRWWNQWTYRGHMPTSYAFLEAPTLPTNSESRYGIRTVNANKITYYTPEYYGFMIGVSYIPDTSVNGTIAKAGSTTKTVATVIDKTGTNNNAAGIFAIPYRNVFEGGIHYQAMYNDWGIKAALLGQTGQAKKTLFTQVGGGSGALSTVTPGTIIKNNKDLNAWEAGLNLSYMGFTLGGSYGDHSHSGNFTRTLWSGSDLAVAGGTRGKKTSYWTAGLGYEYGPVAASFTYFESKQGLPGINSAATTNGQNGHNKLEHYTFGLDYKLAPGLMPYLEVSAFKMKNRHYENIGTFTTGGAYSHGNRGTIVLVGSKLEF